MTSSVKKRLGHGVNIFLTIILIFAYVSTGQALVSGDRAIGSSVLTAGNSTNVTVTINSSITQSLSLKETIPSGWNLTNIKGEESMFKPSTNEWTWFTVTGGTPVIAKYKLTVPSGTAPGIYNINGNVSTENISDASVAVTGAKTVEVKSATLEDTIAPTTVLGGVVEGGVYVDTVTIILTATDNVGGSGVKNTTYSLNGAAIATYSAPITVTNIGQNNLTYRSTDNAGNVENIKKINFTINKAVSIFGIKLDAETYSFITGQGSVAISANVTKGAYNISQVEFGIVNSNGLNSKSTDTVLIYYKDLSGKSGLYGPQSWAGEYARIYSSGNVAVSDVVTPDITPGYKNVRGVFNASGTNTSKDIDAVLSFSTKGTLYNVTEFTTGKPLVIQNANSTFRASTTRFTNGTFESVNSKNVFKLYNTSGNSAVDNPNIVVETVAVGQYTVYAFAKDVKNNLTNDSAVINVDPVPTYNRGSSGGGGGTYPTPTATTVSTRNGTAVPTTTVTPKPTVTVEPTVVRPVETAQNVPIETPKKKTPGIGTIAVIGIIGTIYIIRRRK